MTKGKDVRQTFTQVAEQTSLGVFVKFAIEGVGDNPAFGGNRLSAAVEARGSEAARELLTHLKGLPAQAACKSAEEFITGFVSATKVSRKELADWEAVLTEVFNLMMIASDNDDPYEFGKRLIAVIRKASDLAAPRLRAWGAAASG